ncbi:protein TsetseEP [Drosophila nasuta]|uniref:protein TsetseEP n=1 Tax=Drosophila nasuta TaxID=42062 RepID=UPI00295F46B4|nr:protein TsetseEP [Drosophila nasuta]
MFAKLCVLFLAIGLSQAASSKVDPDVSFMQYMMKSSALIQASSTSTECFGIYLPKLQDVAEQWKADTIACEDTAEEAREQIDDKTKDNRTAIDASATGACAALTTCSQKTSALDYFECYEKAGSDDAKIMYTISANSAELLAVVIEDYRLIDNEKFVCTNKSERAYVENTAQVYDDLDLCLRGIEVTTTTSTTTQAPTSSESTTEESTDSSPTSPSEDTSSSSAAPSEDTSSSAAPSEDTSSSAAPTESSTEAPSEPTDSDKENLPEEDLSTFAAEQAKLKSMIDDFKKLFNRN